MSLAKQVRAGGVYKFARRGGLFFLRILAGAGFASEIFSVRLQAKHLLVQKILGFNRHVPWPVHWTSRVLSPDKIERGTRFPGLAYGCHIDGRNGIVFEENVWVGPRVSIVSMNHNLNDYFRYELDKPVVIRRNCWLATNSVILPGVELGEHTIVAAGAVVTKSFPEGNQILAGNPAKVIRKLECYNA